MKPGVFCLIFSVCASAALAETPRSELPPVDSDALVYTDDRGCVYQRVTVGGWTLWIEREGEDQNGLCKVRSIPAALPDALT